jgi:type VI secretion system protein VasD
MRSHPILAAIVSTLALSACGAWQAVSDTTAGAYLAVFHQQVKVLNIDLTARASLNPDEANRACSVAVRVYQLKDRQNFDSASYDELLKHDKTTLAQDLQDTLGVVVNPGGAASLSQPLQPETRYVAIVAFYRDATNDRSWRRVIPKKSLSPDQPLKFELIDRELVAATDVPRERPAR